MSEAVLIGLTSWPWAARAIRAQTFSLASRDFVNLARLSGRGSFRVIVNEIAPNMSSYLFLTFILLFGGSVLTAATLDFLGLGPSQVMSLGLMMNTAVSNAALQLGMWWWFIPPGLAITAIVGGLYVMNVGPRRGLQPETAPHMSLAVDNLRVYYRTLQGDVRALDGVTLHRRRRRDHGHRRRVGLRQDDARQEPDPARRAHARGRGHGRSSTGRSCRSPTTTR